MAQPIAPIVQAIHDALVQARQHPAHALALTQRQAIWQLLDAPQPDQMRIGYRRRATLAILTARYVMPFWQQTWPNDMTPQQLLHLAERSLNQPSIVMQVLAAARQQWSAIHQAHPFPDRATYVAYAAVRALATVASDEPLRYSSSVNPTDLGPQQPMPQIDGAPDGASYAAASCAGGFPGSPQSDARQRLLFWEWWLTDAVPSVYLGVSDNSMVAINKEQATYIAQIYVEKRSTSANSSGQTVSLAPAIEKPYGWFFSASDNPGSASGDVTYFLIERYRGRIHTFAPRQPLEESIAEYDRRYQQQQ